MKLVLVSLVIFYMHPVLALPVPSSSVQLAQSYSSPTTSTVFGTSTIPGTATGDSGIPQAHSTQILNDPAHDAMLSTMGLQSSSNGGVTAAPPTHSYEERKAPKSKPKPKPKNPKIIPPPESKTQTVTTNSTSGAKRNFSPFGIFT